MGNECCKTTQINEKETTLNQLLKDQQLEDSKFCNEDSKLTVTKTASKSFDKGMLKKSDSIKGSIINSKNQLSIQSLKQQEYQKERQINTGLFNKETGSSENLKNKPNDELKQVGNPRMNGCQIDSKEKLEVFQTGSKNSINYMKKKPLILNNEKSICSKIESHELPEKNSKKETIKITNIDNNIQQKSMNNNKDEKSKESFKQSLKESENVVPSKMDLAECQESHIRPQIINKKNRRVSFQLDVINQSCNKNLLDKKQLLSETIAENHSSSSDFEELDLRDQKPTRTKKGERKSEVSKVKKESKLKEKIIKKIRGNQPFNYL